MNKNLKIISISIIILVVAIVLYFILLYIYNPFCKTEGEGGYASGNINILGLFQRAVFIFSPSQKCCSGLNKMPPESLDDRGVCIRPIGTALQYVCTKCGDGICGKKENICNCPNDCK